MVRWASGAKVDPKQREQVITTTDEITEADYLVDFGPEDEVEQELIASRQNVRDGGGKQERQEADYLLYSIWRLQDTTTPTTKMGKEEDERLAKAIAKDINATKGSGSSGGIGGGYNPDAKKPSHWKNEKSAMRNEFAQKQQRDKAKARDIRLTSYANTISLIEDCQS